MSSPHLLSNSPFEDYDPLSDLSSDNIQQNFNNMLDSFSDSLSIIEEQPSNPLNPNTNQHNSSFSDDHSFIQSTLRKKRNKSDLNNTPLPLFSCIYCSNEHIAFNHLSSELISKKYLYGTSPYDIQLISKLYKENLFSIEHEYPKLFKSLISNSEYISKYYKLESVRLLMNTKSFAHICLLNQKRCSYKINRKVEMFINKKKQYVIGLNSIVKNNNNTKSNTLQNNKLNINSTNSNSNENNNNNSSFNCNSISLNWNGVEKENNMKGQLGIIELDNIVEKIENVDNRVECEEEDFFNFLRFDLKRKINKKEIEWEDKCYNVWEPELSEDELE